MPDRQDPNLSIRPPGERKPEQKSGEPKNDDPLVELARVVSNRSSSIGGHAPTVTPSGAGKPPASGRTAPLPSETDLARDLEEELLNELQASFSMVPEVVGRSAQKLPEAPSVTANEPSEEATEEPVELDQQVEQPEESPIPLETTARPSIAEPELSFHPPGKAPVEELQPDDILNRDILNLGPEFSFGLDPSPSAPHPRQVQSSPFAGPRRLEPEPDVEPRPETVRIRPPPSEPSTRESLASRIARAAQGGGTEEQAPPKARARAPTPRPTAAPQQPATVRPAGERRRRPDASEFRPPGPASQPPAEPAVRPPRQEESRWDPSPEPEGQPTFDPSRFAPLVGDGPEPHGQGGAPYSDDPADDLFFATDEETFVDEAAPTGEQFEAVPGYGDQDLLAYPEDDLAAMHRRRPRRGPLAIAALLAVLVIGGVTVIMLRSGGSSSPPPIIVADASPTKITPENAGTGEGDSQSKLIYDRVDPNSEIADSQLVTSGDNPVADIPAIPEDDASSDVSRVILGGGPAIDGSAEESGSTDGRPAQVGGGTTVASSASEPAPIGPKKVRTVVVRPDGTIVSSEAVAPEEEATAPQNDVSGTLAELPPASETPPAPASEENPLLSNDFGAEVINNPVPDVAEPDNPIENSASIPDIPPPSPRPEPVSRPAPSSPTVVATPGSSNGPIDVTPGNSARSVPGGLGGGFLVQVSSQRSEATALQTFSELQRRYPSILGDRAPNIQRADLGERGVYYRVRVGYPTREQAVRMCENLKVAGGDCLLATR
jgi:hypothetical protein